MFLRNITPFKELDLAKTNFIATISHELKTPIASLQMCTKLLQDTRVGALNDEQFNITKTMNDEIARLSNITHELLDLAQVESGNIKVNVQTVHPAEIVRYALEAVRFQADQKKLTIETSLQDTISDVKADPDKTTWVLVNLLTNAIRYSPEGGTIILSCTRQYDKVRFAVQDFGPGIDRKYRDRIFSRSFTRYQERCRARGWAWLYRKNSSTRRADRLPWRAKLEKEANSAFSCWWPDIFLI